MSLDIKIKRLRRKLREKRNKRKKNKKFLVVGVVLIVIFSLIGVGYSLKDSFNLNVDKTATREKEKEAPEDSVTKIEVEKEGVRQNKKDWLYNSTTLSYDDVFSFIVEGEKSSYSKIEDKKERREWLKEYRERFGLSTEPERIDRKTAEEIAVYCGYTKGEFEQMFGKEELPKDEVPVVDKRGYSEPKKITGYFSAGGVASFTFEGFPSSFVCFSFDSDLFNKMTYGMDTCTFRVKLREPKTEDREKIEQGLVNFYSEFILLMCIDPKEENEFLEEYTLIADENGNVSLEKLYNFLQEKELLSKVYEGEEITSYEEFEKFVFSEIKNPEFEYDVKIIEDVVFCDKDGFELSQEEIDAIGVEAGKLEEIKTEDEGLE